MLQIYFPDKTVLGINCTKQHKKLLQKMRDEVQRKVDSIREKIENVCMFDDRDVVNRQEDVIVEETHSIGHNLKRGIRWIAIFSFELGSQNSDFIA